MRALGDPPDGERYPAAGRAVLACDVTREQMRALWPAMVSFFLVLAFTTANRIHHDEKRDIVPQAMMNEPRLDQVFRATAEAVARRIVGRA